MECRQLTVSSTMKMMPIVASHRRTPATFGPSEKRPSHTVTPPTIMLGAKGLERRKQGKARLVVGTGEVPLGQMAVMSPRDSGIDSQSLSIRVHGGF